MRLIASRLGSLSLVQARTAAFVPARAVLRPASRGITRSVTTQSLQSSAFSKSRKLGASGLHTSRVAQAEIPKFTNRLVNEKSPYLLVFCFDSLRELGDY